MPSSRSRKGYRQGDGTERKRPSRKSRADQASRCRLRQGHPAFPSGRVSSPSARAICMAAPFVFMMLQGARCIEIILRQRFIFHVAYIDIILQNRANGRQINLRRLLGGSPEAARRRDSAPRPSSHQSSIRERRHPLATMSPRVVRGATSVIEGRMLADDLPRQQMVVSRMENILWQPARPCTAGTRDLGAFQFCGLP